MHINTHTHANIYIYTYIQTHMNIHFLQTHTHAQALDTLLTDRHTCTHLIQCMYIFIYLRTTLHYTTLYTVRWGLIASHYIALHDITLHHIILYTTLPYITVHMHAYMNTCIHVYSILYTVYCKL